MTPGENNHYFGKCQLVDSGGMGNWEKRLSGWTRGGLMLAFSINDAIGITLVEKTAVPHRIARWFLKGP
ncbi:hypothetical protein BH09SUM1_BH09SUM1_28070 [soil metagenome]